MPNTDIVMPSLTKIVGAVYEKKIAIQLWLGLYYRITEQLMLEEQQQNDRITTTDNKKVRSKRKTTK